MAENGVPKECREALERCRSVIDTNIDSMRREGFEPNPWDLEARAMVDAVLDSSASKSNEGWPRPVTPDPGAAQA